MARPGGDEYLTPAEVAARLKVSRATVYSLIERGELAAKRIGMAFRIAVNELETLLDRR